VTAARQQYRSEEPEPIPVLFARAVEEGKSFARAEVNYYKQLALSRVSGLVGAAVFGVAALFLLQASLTTLLVGFGLALATWFPRLGIAGGVVIGAVIGLLLTGLLAWLAVGRIKAAGKESAK